MEQQLSLLKERGNSAFRAENFQEALSFYSTYLTLKRDGVIHSNRSLVLLKLGDNEGSLREAEEAILLRPDFVKGFVRKAVALVALGRIEEARDAYTAGLEIDATNRLCQDGVRKCEEELQVSSSTAASLKHQLKLERKYQPAKQEPHMRLFISSTFKDMVKERDALHKITFPALKNAATEKGGSFVPLDLRWGVVEGDFNHILVCLNEVKRSTHFVCIIGQRYGYSVCTQKTDQEKKTATKLFKEVGRHYPKLSSYADRSVTELELRCALSLLPASNIFVYIRDENYGKFGDENLRVENEEAAVRVEALKRWVKTTGVHVCPLYRDELTLSTQLTTDLTASLTKLTTLPPSLSPALPQPPILPLSDSTLNLLHNYLTSPSHSPLLLSAPEGSGTSVLLKRLLSEISESGHKTLPRHHGRPPLIISYFVGGGGKKQEKRNGRSYLDILGHFVQCVEEEFPGVKKRKEEEGFVKELTREQQIIKRFREVLSLVGQYCHVVWCIDGLHFLENEPLPGSHKPSVDAWLWLPSLLPSSVKLIATSTSCSSSYEERDWEKIVLPPLTKEEKKKLISAYLSYHGKRLPRRVEEKLEGEEEEEEGKTVLFVMTVLEELIASSTYETIEEDFDLYFSAASLEDVFSLVLDRWEEVYGGDIVSGVMSKLWASKGGLREQELVDLCEGKLLSYSHFFQALRPHIRSTSDGRLNLHRSSLRNAVESRYLFSSATQSQLFSKLANYFSSSKKNPAVKSSSLFSSFRNLEEFLHAKVAVAEVGGVGVGRCWEVLCECENFLLSGGALFVKLWGGAGRLIKQQQGLSAKLISICERSSSQYLSNCLDAYQALRNLNVFAQVLSEVGKHDCSAAVAKQVTSFAQHRQSDLQIWYELMEAMGILATEEIALGKTSDADETITKGLSFLGEKKPTKSGIYVPKFGIVSAPSASEASFFDSFDPLSLSNSLGSSDGVGGSGLGVSGLGASGLGGGKYTETVMEKKKREKEREKRRALFVALFFGLAGMVHKKDGDYEAAKVLHHAALKKAKSAYGVRSPSLCPFLYDYGDVLRKTGKYDEATSVYQQALDFCKSEKDEAVPSLLGRGLRELGRVEKKRARYNKAEEYYRQALQIWETVYGSSYDQCVLVRIDLADVYRKKGEFMIAKEMYEELVLAAKETFGEQHITVAEVWNSFGALWKKLGDYVCAKECCEEALEIGKAVLSRRHYKIALFSTNLADALRKLGQYYEATNVYEQALDIVRAVYGNSHSETAEILNGIGLVLKKEGDYEGAILRYKEAVQIIETEFGPKHPKVGIYLNNLADVYRKSKRFDKAEEVLKNAQYILDSSLGSDHVEYADCLFSFARLHLDMGNAQHSISPLNSALTTYQIQLGEKHSKIAFCLAAIAEGQNKMKMYDSAKEKYKEALYLLEETLPKDHPECADVLFGLAKTEFFLQNYEESQQCAERALAIVKKSFGDYHYKVQEIHVFLQKFNEENDEERGRGRNGRGRGRRGRGRGRGRVGAYSMSMGFNFNI